MGGIRTHAPFPLKRCSLTEKENCDRAQKNTEVKHVHAIDYATEAADNGAWVSWWCAYVHAELRTHGTGWNICGGHL